ncbi:MAG: NUDIX domain-containing protein [Bacteroidota bacterium]
MAISPYALNVCANLIIRRGDEVLLGLRQNTSFGNGFYSIISGKVEEGEPVHHTAIREAKEEVGVIIQEDNLVFHMLLQTQEADGMHISPFFIVDRWEGDIINNEPDKCGRIAFFSLNNLPKNILPYVASALAYLQQPSNHRYYRFIDFR